MAKKMTEKVVVESAPVAVAPPTTVTPMTVPTLNASEANGPVHCNYMLDQFGAANHGMRS